MTFPPDSTIPSAAACLKDTVHILKEAQYALHEAIAHRVWYLERTRPPNEAAAVFFQRFYADDVALRLYSASEHLAEAIRDMLEITDKELQPYQNDRRVSRQSVVGHFLRKERPRHRVTLAVVKLVTAKEWQQTHDYRNHWVHSQPPPIKGLGIVYGRGRRWKLSDAGSSHVLYFGGGDEPAYSVEDLLAFIQPALSTFAQTVRDVVGFYVELLADRGRPLDAGVQPREGQ